jgi:5-methylcytosine-specific restriction enzyme subunit McrC
MSPQKLKIIEGKERNRISISREDVFDDEGRFIIHPFTTKKGYVELKHSRTGLELEVRGVVGHLPISDKLTLDIKPKFPVSNLSRMVALSDETLHSSAPIERVYSFDEKSNFLPEAQIRAFAHYLTNLIGEGLEKAYLSKTTTGLPRPKISFGKSQQRYWSRGINHIAVTEQFDLTANLPVNQILKVATKTAHSLIINLEGFEKEKMIFVEVLSSLSRVKDTVPMTLLAQSEKLISEVASYRPSYKQVIPLAVEILKRSTVSFGATSRGIKMPSFILILDNIFESYIRNVLRNYLWATHQLKVRDGNKSRWQKILLNKSNFKVKPDLLIYGSAQEPIIVGDMKYKIEPKEVDRYQILSHTMAYNAKIALLIYPKNREKSGLIDLGKIGPDNYQINLYHYFIDLSEDLKKEEIKMCKIISKLAQE